MVTLTEVLLNDAEVERSVTALHADSPRVNPHLNISNNMNDNNNVAGNGSAGAGATSAVFQSRRTVPGRLCSVPAELADTMFDAEGRPVRESGANIVVSQ